MSPRIHPGGLLQAKDWLCVPTRLKLRGSNAFDLEPPTLKGKAIKSLIGKGRAPAVMLVYKDTCIHCVNFMPYFNLCAQLLGDDCTFLSIEAKELDEILISGARIGGSVVSFPTLRILDTENGRRRGEVTCIAQWDNDLDYGHDDLAACQRLRQLGMTEYGIHALLQRLDTSPCAAVRRVNVSKLEGLVRWLLFA
mgnify:CR=1 FL=1